MNMEKEINKNMEKDRLNRLDGVLQKFAIAIASGKSPQDAYIESGCTIRVQESVEAAARRLMKNPMIQEEIRIQSRALAIAASLANERILGGVFGQGEIAQSIRH